MIAGHSDDVAAVLGVSWPKDEAQATWLTRVQALDAMYIMRSYVGWAERGNPYMGVGATWPFADRHTRVFPTHQRLLRATTIWWFKGSPARLTCALQLRRTGPRTWMRPCRPRGRIGWPRSADIGPQRRITKPRTSGGWPCRRYCAQVRSWPRFWQWLFTIRYGLQVRCWGPCGWVSCLTFGPSPKPIKPQILGETGAACFLFGRRGAHGSLCR